MKDPFFIPPIPWLVDAVQPWADYFDLPTLPAHIHEVLFSALLYTVVFYPLSPMLSNYFAPQHYSKLSRKKQLNWDAHVVSMVQATLINTMTLWVMFVDEERKNMDWEERIWGYTGAAGLIQGFAAGYFLWDLVVTALNFEVFGPGTLAHAAAALVVYSLGFRPFLNYYGCVFILWELSTPFLNIHWFMDKVNMTGTRAQLYNGIILLFSFFSCRLIYGTYQSYRVYSDIWAAIDFHPTPNKRLSPVMLFASETSTVPFWVAAALTVSNLTLNGLNVYWFFMMVRAVRKRFQPAKKTLNEPVTEAGIDMSGVASGLSAEVAKPAQRRRKA